MKTLKQILHETTENPEDEFKRLIQQHDLTYQYSDAGRTYQEGEATFRKIKELAKKIDPARAKTLWNAMVDSKIKPAGRKEFYWP